MTHESRAIVAANHALAAAQRKYGARWIEVDLVRAFERGITFQARSRHLPERDAGQLARGAARRWSAWRQAVVSFARRDPRRARGEFPGRAPFLARLRAALGV